MSDKTVENTPAKHPKEPILAEECFALECSLQKRTKKADILTVVLFCLILFGVLITAIILPDKTMSEQENRTLQQLPKLSSGNKFANRLFDGSFTKDFAKYCSDQFPARDFFVATEAMSELLLGKGENNGVILGKDGYLITKPAKVSAVIQDNLSAVQKLAEYGKDTDIPVYLTVPGRTVDIMKTKYPFLYDSADADAAWEVLSAFTEANNDSLTYIDVRTPLQSAADLGEYVAYKTDHHWTSYGAYLAYRKICKSLGMTPYDITEFTPTAVSSDFFGTTWSSAGFRFTAPDTVEFYRYEEDTKKLIEIAFTDTKPNDGFYETSYLSEKDKYAAFLGGNYSLLTVTGDETLPWVLLYKDSFANSLIPLLARNCNIIAVDPRYYKGLGLEEALEGKEISAILCLYNMDTLLSDIQVKTAPIPES